MYFLKKVNILVNFRALYLWNSEKEKLSAKVSVTGIYHKLFIIYYNYTSINYIKIYI